MHASGQVFRLIHELVKCRLVVAKSISWLAITFSICLPTTGIRTSTMPSTFICAPPASAGCGVRWALPDSVTGVPGMLAVMVHMA